MNDLGGLYGHGCHWEDDLDDWVISQTAYYVRCTRPHGENSNAVAPSAGKGRNRYKERMDAYREVMLGPLPDPVTDFEAIYVQALAVWEAAEAGLERRKADYAKATTDFESTLKVLAKANPNLLGDLQYKHRWVE